ncbi:MAG: ATP-binding protein [Candidatus Eisenbacteria bacterium]|nr:ATP-binding protein [Candidatus Eisenbacteria bacterium]
MQNSLDAGASNVRVIRLRERGVTCLRIVDNGEGVIPELDRPAALRHIATHIGHSRKRDLSPEQRLSLMTQGQYGIGLLGFWSLGQRLEIRSFVPGQRPHHLILQRDRADFLIEPIRTRLLLDERRTEVVVLGLHREAVSALIGRRAADYLASELRGQLLSRDVEVLVEDKISRGRAPKFLPVRPPRFLGERLEGIGPVEVPEHQPVRFEIYLAGDGGAEHPLSVYGAGTLVAESFAELAHLGLARAPWTDARLTGLVDFPGFRVSPGSRRGVVADAAAGAFVRALERVQPLLESILDGFERRRAEELDKTIVRDLQRAFRDFYRQRPRYEMLPVQSESGRGSEDEHAPAPVGVSSGANRAGDVEPGADEPPVGAEPAPATGPTVTDGAADEFPDPASTREPQLFPPGPLRKLRISPNPIRLEPGAWRRLRAHALDASGRPIDTPVEFAWCIHGQAGGFGLPHRTEAERSTEEQLLVEVGSEGSSTVVFHATDTATTGQIEVIAQSGADEAAESVTIEIAERTSGQSAGEGIPEPVLLHEPAGHWRSRMIDGRWEVNAAHREYRAIADQPALKLRYFALLFAKEIVLRSSQDPRLEAPLEQMIEVAAFADRNLSKRRGGTKRAEASAAE